MQEDCKSSKAKVSILDKRAKRMKIEIETLTKKIKTYKYQIQDDATEELSEDVITSCTALIQKKLTLTETSDEIEYRTRDIEQMDECLQEEEEKIAPNIRKVVFFVIQVYNIIVILYFVHSNCSSGSIGELVRSCRLRCLISR